MTVISDRYINVVGPDVHGRELTMANARRYTENFSKPVVFRSMVDIAPELATRKFFDAIEPSQMVQWRRKKGDAPVSQRSKDGKTDYNYVAGEIAGTSRVSRQGFARVPGAEQSWHRAR